MSKQYEMHITIEGAMRCQAKAIAEAVGELWNFPEDQCDLSGEDWDRSRCDLQFCGEDRLCIGTTDEEKAAEVRDAVWAANGGYCQVEVRLTYLEDLPYEEYLYGEVEYADWAEAHGRAPAPAMQTA